MTQPTKYRKRPVEIEAIRYRPGPDGNCSAVAKFIGDGSTCDDPCDPETEWVIQTLEGEMTARPGDWIIRGVRGEFYPCKPDIFAATYEAVGGAA
jgi:hypothetical protein